MLRRSPVSLAPADRARFHQRTFNRVTLFREWLRRQDRFHSRPNSRRSKRDLAGRWIPIPSGSCVRTWATLVVRLGKWASQISLQPTCLRHAHRSLSRRQLNPEKGVSAALFTTYHGHQIEPATVVVNRWTSRTFPRSAAILTLLQTPYLVRRIGPTLAVNMDQLPRRCRFRARQRQTTSGPIGPALPRTRFHVRQIELTPGDNRTRRGKFSCRARPTLLATRDKTHLALQYTTFYVHRRRWIAETSRKLTVRYVRICRRQQEPIA